MPPTPDIPPAKAAPGRDSHSRPYVTVLFTDIVDSTRHWHEHGDVETRYRIEQHNASLMPVVEAYAGRVVKTIGDSIMAAFDNPENAVRAAIAMQHALHEVREKDPDFEMKVRIGIHRGRALVEDDDIYGNTVNVASRVESEAQGDEILVSGSVAQSLDQERYFLTRRGSFTPRGKSNSILLYRVSWWRTECRLEKVPESARQVRRGALAKSLRSLPAACVQLAGLAWIATLFAPVFLAAKPGWQAHALNPAHAIETDPVLVAGGATAILIALLLIGAMSARLHRLLGALALGWLVLAGVELAASWFEIEFPGAWQREFDLGGARWVEIASAGKVLHAKPSLDSPVVARLREGHRLPLDQRAETRRGAAWLRVSHAPARFAWMPDTNDAGAHRVVPATAPGLCARDLHATGLAGLSAALCFARSRRLEPGRRRGPRRPRRQAASV